MGMVVAMGMLDVFVVATSRSIMNMPRMATCGDTMPQNHYFILSIL